VVTSQGEALLSLDDARRMWRAEGNTVKEIPLAKTDTWKSVGPVATFAGNIYILDPKAGQLWRYEPDFAGELGDPIGFLPQALPADAARGLAVDGDIWILTDTGEVQRYRRQGIDRVLTRLPLTLTWNGPALRPTYIQAIDSQRSIWLLDATARVVAQVTRDGREVARFSLPDRLPDATAFFVSEGQHTAYSVHGAKIVATDTAR
jgi:sugar lactone lactonase YvrE